MLKEKLQDLAARLGLPVERVEAAVLAPIDETQKTAEQSGVRFKAEGAPPAEAKDDKAPPVEDKPAEGAAPAAAQGGEQPAAPPAEPEPPLSRKQMEDMMGGMQSSMMGLMADAIAQAIAPLVQAADFEGKSRAMLDEMKSLIGGYQKQKDDSEAVLKAQIEQLQKQLTDLTGEQPKAEKAAGAGAYRASADPFTIVDPQQRAQALAAQIKTQAPPGDEFDGLLGFLSGQTPGRNQ